MALSDADVQKQVKIVVKIVENRGKLKDDEGNLELWEFSGRFSGNL
jgi:hypothetical protein